MLPRRNTQDSEKDKKELTIFLNSPEALKYAWKGGIGKFTYSFMTLKNRYLHGLSFTWKHCGY